jgi:chromosomal replication initiator protein
MKEYLESICKTQIWVKNHLKKEIQLVDKINTLSISSIRQKLKTKKMTVNYPLEIILTAVCDYYQITLEDLKEKKRTSYLANARQMYCYIAREFSIKSFKEIGGFIGFSNGNIIYAINEVKIKKDIYPKVKKDIEAITINLFNKDSIVINDINLLSLCENESKLFI